MRLGYTEFSFGYAFTENLIRASSVAPKGAPMFPNLVQEAQLGYDVKIDLPGFPIFFQYKLPELMKRNTAFEISKNLAGLKVPFFRMMLMRSSLSDQHKLLMRLEKKYPNAVFYASPTLYDLDAFNKAYRRGSVHTSSVFFSPGDIGPLPDDRTHTISYCVTSPFAWLNSDPKEVTLRTYEMLEAHVRPLFDSERFRSLRAALSELLEIIRLLVSTSMREAESGIRNRVRARRSVELDTVGGHTVEDILVAREMARIDLGLDLFFSQSQQ